MGKKVDIFGDDGPQSDDELKRLFEGAAAAAERKPVPAGTYECLVEQGSRTTSRTGKPSYKIVFKVADGEHAGRLVWLDLWLTGDAMPLTKRDLAKLGITSWHQLDCPFPAGIYCMVTVTVRTSDAGVQFNNVRDFQFSRRVKPEADPFAPAIHPAEVGGGNTAGDVHDGTDDGSGFAN